MAFARILAQSFDLLEFLGIDNISIRTGEAEEESRTNNNTNPGGNPIKVILS